MTFRETYKDQSTSRSPGRNRCKDWGEEDRDQEADAGSHGSEASLPALGDASSGLDEGSAG